MTRSFPIQVNATGTTFNNSWIRLWLAPDRGVWPMTRFTTISIRGKQRPGCRYGYRGDGSRTVLKTIADVFDQPFHLAVNVKSGKTYVANYGNATVTVLAGTDVSGVVDLFDSTSSRMAWRWMKLAIWSMSQP